MALSTMASRTGCTSVSDLEMIRRMSPVAVSRSSAFRQLAVPPLERLAQALVLEGDRRLVGEGPEERDLLRRERPDLKATDRDQPDGEVVAQQGDEQERAEPLAEVSEPRVSPLGGGRRDVMHVDRAALEDDPAGRQRRCDRDRLADLDAPWEWTPGRQDPELVALHPVDVGVGRVAEPRGGPRDGLEDGRDVLGGARAGGPGLARPGPVAGGRRLRADFVSWLHEPPLDGSPEVGPAAPGECSQRRLTGQKVVRQPRRGSSGGRGGCRCRSRSRCRAGKEASPMDSDGGEAPRDGMSAWLLPTWTSSSTQGSKQRWPGDAPTPCGRARRSILPAVFFSRRASSLAARSTSSSMSSVMACI